MKRINCCLMTLLLVTGITGRALAQPDPNNPPKAVNPRGKTDAERAAELETRRQEKLKKREARQREVRAEYGARLMNSLGLTDKAEQNALIDYYDEMSKARLPLLQATTKIRAAVKNQVKDAELATLVKDYRAASESYETRLKQAEATLEQKTAYSKKPRLEAVVIMLRSMAINQRVAD
ncbi:MAG: hypothetical protein M3347_04705 [Armatimonadota bacterium]|nr:hypothetical protein [Armatimonadota bacterium]